LDAGGEGFTNRVLLVSARVALTFVSGGLSGHDKSRCFKGCFILSFILLKPNERISIQIESYSIKSSMANKMHDFLKLHPEATVPAPGAP